MKYKQKDFLKKDIQCVQRIKQVNIVGIRHLSPNGSFYLINLLERIKPTCVLIEAPSDLNDTIIHIVSKNVVPPIAILAYTEELPIDTIAYPLAEYSPEYQALLWSNKNNADTKFIDLPTTAFFSFKKEKYTTDEEIEKIEEYHYNLKNIYKNIATLDKCINYEDYFEKNFEQSWDDYERLKFESQELRKITEPLEAENTPNKFAENYLRESYMAYQIEEAIKKHDPEKIVVITGAYHANQLSSITPMTESEVKSLPHRKSKTTLMPYSFYKLSRHSGYGAGNNAPAYYQLMWECTKKNIPMVNQYMSTLAQYIREKDGYCSTANVIEGVKLANSLAYLKGSAKPTLEDMHESAITCLGEGERNKLVLAFASTDIGTVFGSLPEGVSQTPLQDDFNREIKRLKIEKYKQLVATTIELDLRENTRVKSKEAAFIDLNRSTFFHRLSFLGIDFSIIQRVKQDNATWREIWNLQWTPEVEIQLVESVLKGETIELAAYYQLKEKLEDSKSLSEVTELIWIACVCQLTSELKNTIKILQELVTDTGEFIEISKSCQKLSSIIQYGSLRNFNTIELEKILGQIFLRGTLLMVDYAGCDNKLAKEVVPEINAMHNISQENFNLIDDQRWVKELEELAKRDDRNPILSGLAFSILLERNLATESDCAVEISRRLSQGTPADLGASWFEGLSQRNRYALLSRTFLWQQLDIYVNSLDDEEFKRCIVFLRRAFSTFEPREKSSVAKLLGEIWNIDEDEASILLESRLNEEELKSLDEFDFDF